MTTYRDVMYMIFDELGISSDDSFWNENHIAFLMNKYRAILLRQKYNDLKKDIPEKIFQQICIDINYNADCVLGTTVKSIQDIPSLMSLGDDTIRYDIYPYIDYFDAIEWTLVSRDRLKYVGNNKWLNKIVYFALAPDRKMYLKSMGIDYKYIKKIIISGVFDDPVEANKLKCDNDNNENCDEYGFEFPLDEYLTATLITMVIQHLKPDVYTPKDKDNNANDDLSEINIRNN